MLNSHGVVLFGDIERSVPAASEFIRKLFQTKKRNQIYHHANMLNLRWHNHSLKLTEPVVDDFARAK
jgi:DNA-binding MurR/RpiR family transcriptional regulator